MPDEQIQSLIEKRGLLKAALTRLKAAVDKFDINNDSINQLKARLPNLQSTFRDFDDIQNQIELKDNSNKQNKERNEFESKYYDVESAILTYIDQHNTSLSSNQSSTSETTDTNKHSINNVRLPLLNLPTYEGSYTDWMSFHDTFKALIHESKLYTNIEKFHYLRSCLRGEPLKTVESVTVSDVNYQLAWDVLKKRYENLRLIVQEHVFALLNSPQLQKGSHTSMRQLVDDVCINLEALRSLKQPVDQWDAIIIPIIVMKFDFQTRKDWESTLNSEMPKLKEITQFLERKCLLLESLNASNKQQNHSKVNQSNANKPANYGNNKARPTNCLVTNTNFRCYLCKGDHSLYKCNQFLNLSISDRIKKVKDLKLCTNCFRNNHTVNNCKSSTCRTCNEKHNTLLHTSETNATSSTVVAHTQNSYNTSSQVLLCTAQLLIKNIKGNWIKCRALLDVGSQSNFIIKEKCDVLQQPLNKVNIPINGINESNSNANHVVNIEFKSIHSPKVFKIQCLVLPKITENLPTTAFTTNNLQIPSILPLADPSFNESNKIDVLLGAGIFWSLLRGGQIPETLDNPHLQETELGWVIGGNIKLNSNSTSSLCHLSTLEKQMAKFWTVEELSNNKLSQYSLEELNCIEHFNNTHKRTEEGRFIVRLPFKNTPLSLGESKNMAIKRLGYLENKLKRDPELTLSYHNFMQEYEDLNHMQVLSDNMESDSHYYLPHHAVVKETSSTTKVRVVFDASASTTSGLSLNDILMIGPKLQDDLFLILLRFRTYQFVLSADINKMYRQILVADEDKKYQRIVWRHSETDSVATYELNTVTYGTACAPYLAVQCLQQLACDEKQQFPEASNILMRDFYMDDLLTGTNSFDEALQLRIELQALLSRGGFELRKWSSNESSLLPQISESESNSHMINLEKDNNTKLLGLWWNYENDYLNYVVNSKHIEQQHVPHTKRSVLSKISQIFDPLGLLSPIIINAKLILQQLWQINQGWDDPLPQNSDNAWSNLVNQFNDINKISIQRKVIDFHPTSTIQFHGFSDASEKAYGACIYIRSTNSNGQIAVNLLCAKSRVAPLKVLTIPRLELCGALLLCRLMKVVCESINMKPDQLYYWTDSAIVLAWLSMPPNNLKTFVANRIVEIQSSSKVDNWRHIKSFENPADLTTRGISPKELNNHSLWFHGPTWLTTDEANWSKSIINNNSKEIPEQRILSHAVSLPNFDWMHKYTNFNKLQRITAFCLRPIYKVRNKQEHFTRELKVKEIQNATNAIIKTIQNLVFSQELKDLRADREINNKSQLKTLNPFLDANGLIRVGGRLRHANISPDQKHPIILPKHHVTELIILSVHERLLHAGNLGTLASIREHYWPLAGRRQVRKVLNKCIPCFRAYPKDLNPIMGDLPAARCEFTRPFVNCGIDYAGPVFIKEGRGRGKRKLKSYICLFICFATKAIHLELVSDLTSECFLNALKRFIARRGLVENVYSDNATNFVGANKELNSLKDLFHSEQFKNKVVNNLRTNNITWHFIPARSPHFGGLWEAGVKRTKHHLKRVLGNALLTFEELYTLLTCIEACLNSRPIMPLSNDPNDLSALTPGHFLIGSPLTATPEPSLMQANPNRLSRWQYLEQVRQHFWKRWTKEYLGYLQPRPTSKSSDTTMLQPGTLVVLKDINAPPLVWKYGRIVELHPGADGITRVVSIQTDHGITKRAVRNICVVPVSESQEPVK